VNTLDIKIKIVVAVKEDGTDDVREVTIEQAIAFVKNQLDALEALRKANEAVAAEKWKKAMEEGQKQIEKGPFTVPQGWDHIKPWTPNDFGTTWNSPNITWTNGTGSTNGSIINNSDDHTAYPLQMN
jgi:hypothetical protein